MKILLDWKKPETEIKTLIAALQEKHEVVYCLFPDDDSKPLSRAVFHDVHLARKALPAEELAAVKFDPPGKELIEKMYQTESIILTMMNRKFADKSVDERRHIYYHMLGYWYGVLRKFKPDIVIFNAIPHAIYNYVIFGLAKLLGIKTLMFIDTWEPDQILPIADYIELNQGLRAEIEKNRSGSFSIADLSPSLRAYYELQIDPRRDATPPYIKKQIQEHSLSNKVLSKWRGLRASLENGAFGRILASNFTGFFRARPGTEAEKEYRLLEQRPDFSQPYVYVGLHYQPERTTSPQGEIFADQILMVEMLSYSLPAGWKIYVKEHPMQWFLRGAKDPHRFRSVRYPDYYRRIARLPQVTLVPPETDTFKLIKDSRAVATVTGTVGFEALVRGKPVLLFGYSWYRFCPEVFFVNSAEGCQAALAKISAGWLPSRQAVLNFLKSADNLVVYAYSDEFGEKNSSLKPKENIRRLADLVLRELRSYQK